MNSTAIEIRNISKRYRVGERGTRNDTFSGTIATIFMQPFRNFQRIRRLNKFDKNEPDTVNWALDNVSFNVKQGEALGIIGHNGAGKSTLLKILSRITEPTSGEILIRGRVSALLEVGTGFHPELTGRDNVYMNGTLLGMTKKEIDLKFDEIVDFSGVEKYIDTPVKFYSSGMRVRLAFSVAAFLEPEILIIDEVLAVGDFEFQKKCIGKMDSISKGGRTVLFVSHNMVAVGNLCKKTVILDKGRVLAYDESHKIINQYMGLGSKAAKLQLNEHIEGTGISLLSIELCSDTNNSYFDISKPIDIKLKVEFSENKKNKFHVRFIFRAGEGGDILFIAPSTPQPFCKGIVDFFCHVPANFLNSIIYCIDVSIFENVFLHISVDALKISGVEPNSYTALMGKNRGVIRPDCVKCSVVDCTST